MSDGRAALAANLKRLRIARGSSQKGLAAEAGVSFRSIQNAESGLSGMDADTLVALADTFNLSVDDLVRDPDQSRPISRDSLLARIVTALPALDEHELGAVLDLVTEYTANGGDPLDQDHESG